MTYCTVCGTEVISNFCPKCGKAATRFSEAENRYTPSNEYTSGYNNQYRNQPYEYSNNPYVYSYSRDRQPISNKSRLVALLLCIFVGCLGIHHFYVGRTGYGVLYIFTGGLFGIGWFIDLILLATGTFKDSYGFFVSDWNA